MLDARRVMASIKAEFNLNTIVQLISLAILLVTAGIMYRDVTAENEKVAMRVARLEERVKRNDDDHDLLIEIRTKLGELSAKVDRALPQRFGAN